MLPTERPGALRQRHLTLIALGGVIGASLFVGSGSVIHAAGPAAVLSYAAGGVLVFLVMRMLGEMATARPTVGSFMNYAIGSLGRWAGFTVGWLYWYFWVGIVAFEAVVGGRIVGSWLDAPNWVFALLVLLVFTLTNLVSTRSFGETEFWLASVKVATIVVFLLVGALYVLGWWPTGDAPGLSHLTGGAFLPHGMSPVVQGIVIAVFSYFGTEIVTIAAAESRQPAKAIARASNTIVWRIAFFYIGTIALLVTITPWADVPTETSPFAAAFDSFGIPAAEQIINVVVLTAALSVLNTSLYAGSRMLFALAEQGWAPKWVETRSRRGVPWKAVLLCTVGGYAAVGLNYGAPEAVFTFVMNSAGAVALFVYAFICLSQLRLRKTLLAEHEGRLPLKMWLHPWLALATLAAIAAVLVVMAIETDTREQVTLSILSLAFIVAVYFAFVRRREPAVQSAGEVVSVGGESSNGT